MTRKKETETATEETKETETSQQETPEKAAQAPEAVKELEVCAPNGLNLRSGPHQSYPLVGVLTNGARVTPLGVPVGIEVPLWTPVETDLGRGWVMAEFLRAVPEAE